MEKLRKLAVLVAAVLFLFALLGLTPIDSFSALQEAALGGLILAVLALL